MENSEAAFWCEESLVLSGGSRFRTREVEVGAGDFVFVTGEFGACSVQGRKGILASKMSVQKPEISARQRRRMPWASREEIQKKP